MESITVSESRNGVIISLRVPLLASPLTTSTISCDNAKWGGQRRGRREARVACVAERLQVVVASPPTCVLRLPCFTSLQPPTTAAAAC